MATITLSTDIGQQDYIVGAVKGQLISHNKDFNIIDITHYLSRTNYPQAAYICANAFKYYPAGTFHIIILNFFDNALKHVLVAKYNGQYIICPDNGIITLIAGEKPKEIAKLALQENNTLLSRTAIIAKAIEYINNNNNLIIAANDPVSIVETYPLKATLGDDWIEGQILFIDNFENVVINITKTEFEEQRRGRKFVILFSRNEKIEKISDNYANAPEGDNLAWFNSAGYLEIAVNKGNIASLFGLQGYHDKMNKTGNVKQNNWFYQTVKIFFEER